MPVDDADLARLLRRHLADLLTWLDDDPPGRAPAVRKRLRPEDHMPLPR